MAKTFLSTLSLTTILQCLVPFVIISFVSSEKCSTEVDTLWEKYGELKADIERLKSQSRTCGGPCPLSTSTIEPITSTTPMTTTTTIDNEDKMTDIGFDLLSVTKQEYVASNETELTVTVLAPEDAVFYWFESLSNFIPAYEDGEYATIVRRGNLTLIKLRKHLRDDRHYLVCLSTFTGMSLMIDIGRSKNVFSPPEQHCKYSNIKTWETDSTFNSNITFQCNTLLNNFTMKSQRPFIYQLEKDSNSVEIIQTFPDSVDSGVNQTEQNDGSVSMVYSMSKEKYRNYYAWIDYGLILSKNGDELVDEINFFVFANKAMNGGRHPLLPPGRVGFYNTQDIELKEGDDSYIPCFAIGNQAPYIRIGKRDTEYDDTHLISSDQYKALGELGFTWIKLTSVSQRDAGEYRCLAYLNDEIPSMNITVKVLPKNYDFYVEDVSQNMTADGMINATFQAFGYPDINVKCNFDNVQDNVELNDTVTVKEISAQQALLTYTALVDPKIVSMGPYAIQCDVTDAFNSQSVFIDLYVPYK